MAETQKTQAVEERRQQGSQGIERRRGGSEGLMRSGELFPFLARPSEFFSASPFAMMRRMMQDMDRMFLDRMTAPETGEMGTWWPAVEVSEQSGELVVRADLPGLKKEDVKVELTDEGLILRGERKREHEQREGQMYRSERSYGSFYRSIALPEGAKTDQVKAQFNDGVLEVTIPMPEEQRRRREIPIEAGGEKKSPGSETSSQQRQSKTG